MRRRERRGKRHFTGGLLNAAQYDWTGGGLVDWWY
jgi:hypothetical protein